MRIDLDKLLGSSSGRSKKKGLVILSNGLGRDSATMVALLVEGKLMAGGRRILPRDVDAVVFSDTGYEWGFTYQAIPAITRLLESTSVNIPFFVLRKPPKEKYEDWVKARRAAFVRAWSKYGDAQDPRFVEEMKASKLPPPWVDEQFLSLHDKAEKGGYHRAAPLVEEFETFSRLNMRASPECTDRHKIQPINRLIEDMTQAKYGVSLARGANSWEAMVERGEAEPHEILIGFTSDEEKRVERGGKAAHGKDWKVERYPLMEMGVSKDDESKILARHGLDWIQKSGCFVCHWQPVSWFWALRENNPELFARVVAYEARALTRNPKWFLKGSKPITEQVDAWRRANPRATVADVLDKSYVRCGKF